jgi:hypothetical protein
VKLSQFRYDSVNQKDYDNEFLLRMQDRRIEQHEILQFQTSAQSVCPNGGKWIRNQGNTLRSPVDIGQRDRFWGKSFRVSGSVSEELTESVSQSVGWMTLLTLAS